MTVDWAGSLFKTAVSYLEEVCLLVKIEAHKAILIVMLSSVLVTV
jgi:hypothetical protein